VSRNIFGWDLPPGCTNADIERAFGDSPDPISDDFLEDKKVEFAKEERKWIEDNYGAENEIITNVLSKLFSWAYQQGYDQAKADEEEAKFYEQQARESKEFIDL